jgi:hypothetical protein
MVRSGGFRGGAPPLSFSPKMYHIILVKLKISDLKYLNFCYFRGVGPSFWSAPPPFEISGSATGSLMYMPMAHQIRTSGKRSWTTYSTKGHGKYTFDVIYCEVLWIPLSPNESQSLVKSVVIKDPPSRKRDFDAGEVLWEGMGEFFSLIRCPKKKIPGSAPV